MAKDKIGVYSEADAKKIARAVQKFIRQPTGNKGRQRKRIVVSGGSVRLAQAPVGGIPARAGATPGEATCTQVIIAALPGVGFAAGDLVKTSLTFTVLNWDLLR